MDEMKQNKMGTMPCNRLLLSMSVPMMLSMLVQALYNIVDSIFVARLSEDALTAVARHYLETSQCPRFMEQHTMRERKQYLAELAKEYKADGIIIEQMKFCEYWSYERTIDTIILQRDYGIPVCSIEKEYVNNAVGQLRTRFQAFVESIEIKQLARKNGTAATEGSK